ncbi:MAG: class I SAM-dependent methyltransferase [Patescibacteria group bacterium]|nr:class I SAM-dependent methyltransferase [Patescibacteria group bacterium]
MTTWDNIYKDFQQGGEAWATLSEGIDEKFQEFIASNAFYLKSAFDIGCGTGKYLKYLKGLGFVVEGIDSSPTAIKMTKENLGDNVKVEVANMFEFNITGEKYDLILSISTIHHGLKHEVKSLLKQIHAKLSKEGKIFITIPDLDKALFWNTFKDHNELEPGTYAPKSGPEIGLAHSFFTKDEILEMFKDYRDLKMELDDIGRWFVTGTK